MNWEIDALTCDSWFIPGDMAIVNAKYGSRISASLRLVLAENSAVIVSKFILDDAPLEIAKQVKGDPRSEIQILAMEELNEWKKEIQRILKWLPKGQWKKGPGNSFELEYAVLAYLVVVLGEFNGKKAISRIAHFLEVPVSTAKQRVRESRARGYLTEPGKGIRGTTDLTATSKKLLKLKGVIHA